MRKFAAGLVLGLILGGSIAAVAACIRGGQLNGWTVMKDGEEMCSDPSVDEGRREVSCD